MDQVVLQVINVSPQHEINEFYISFYQDTESPPIKAPKIKKWHDQRPLKPHMDTMITINLVEPYQPGQTFHYFTYANEESIRNSVVKPIRILLNGPHP